METKNLDNESITMKQEAVDSIFYTTSILKEMFNDELKTFDLSLEQFNVLQILREKKGTPCSLFCIQEKMITKMSNTSRLVDKLLLKKYVIKHRDVNNKRKVSIFITKKGMNVLTELDSLIINVEKNAFKMLSANELIQFVKLLKKVSF